MLRARTITLSLVVVAVVLVAPPLQGKDRKQSGYEYKSSYAYTEKLSDTFPLKSEGRLSLENINGDVRISTWERNEVSVEATKRATSQARLDDLEVHMEAEGDHVRIRAEFTRETKWDHGHGGATVDFEIKVPRTIRIDEVSLVNGDLDVDGLTGQVQASCVNGALTASELSGDVNLSTVNGTLEVTFEQLDASASIRLQTVNGTVDVTLPKKAGARVRASTVNGAIVNDLGLTVSKHDVVGASLRGTIGDGGASINVDAVNGTIRIRGEDGER
jgi:putative adhesin